MENKCRTFGEIVADNILEPFRAVCLRLKELDANDPEVQTLLEVADAITYDETKAQFHQVYQNVPGQRRGSLLTVYIPMTLQEVHLLTEFITNHLDDPRE